MCQPNEAINYLLLNHEKNIKNLFRKPVFEVNRYNLNTSPLSLMERLLEYQHIGFSMWVLTVEDCYK